MATKQTYKGPARKVTIKSNSNNRKVAIKSPRNTRIKKS